MAKSKKKQKKTADFQKVKLKVGKTKPSGDNVTKTAFKTASVTIGEQFKTGDEPVNRKNLTLRELLNQIQHYNVNVRNEALSGMLDLFKTHPTMMHDNISTWLSKVFLKISDTDSDVRRALFVLLSHVFANLLEVEVSPFFKVIVTHICCGLTHIHEGVQLDSLDVLGIVLDRYPSLFMPHSMKILENVIDLISTQTLREGSAKGSKAKKGISSLVSYNIMADADSSLTTIKNRTRILEKLYAIVKIFRRPPEQSEAGVDDGDVDVVRVKNGGQIFAPRYKYSTRPTCMEWVELASVLEMGEKCRMQSDTKSMNTILLQIFPVILNIWVEYEPQKLSATFQDSHIKQSILNGMKVIIDVLDILLDPLQECGREFYENIALLFKTHTFGVDIMSHFLNYFVLALPNNSSKSISSKSSAGNHQRFVIDFNFVMAKIVCSLLVTTGGKCLVTLESKQRTEYFKQLSCFVALIIDSNSLIVDKKKISELLSVVDTLVQIKHSCDKKEVEVVDVGLIFKELFIVYQDSPLSSPWKVPILLFFSKYVVDHKYSHLVKDQGLAEYTNCFMKSLLGHIWSMPAHSLLLIKESFTFIKLILVRNLIDEEMMAILSGTLCKIFKPSCLFTNLNVRLQRCVVEIVFYADITDALLVNLARVCHLESVDADVRKYLISVIGYCLHRKDRPIEFEKYISFMFSAAIGFTMDGLQKFNVERSNNVSWSVLNVFCNESKPMPVGFIIEQLSLLDDVPHIVPILISVMGQLLIQLRKLPVTVAFSLINMLYHFSSLDYDVNNLLSPDLEINQIADLLSAIFLYAFSDTYKSVTNDHVTPRTDEQLTMEDNLITSCIRLLLCNNLLLRQLIKKWINIMGEYKTNATCVNSIVEVLVKLLQEQMLVPALREFKPNFQSVVNVFYPLQIPQIERGLIEQLRTRVMLL